MWSRDFLRVLQGAGKVAEQLAKTQSPEIREHSAQLAAHANELSRLIPYLLENAAAQQQQQQQQQQQSSPQWSEATDAQGVPSPSSESAAVPAPTMAAPDADRPAHAPPSRATASMAAATPAAAPIAPATATQSHSNHQEWESPFAQLDVEKAASNNYQTVKQVLHETHTADASASITPASDGDAQPERREWTERSVPSSPLSRIMGFGGLAARLAAGTAAEIVRTGGRGGTRQALISDSNAERLAETLCTMRGAALKLGQMLSIQDENLVPSKLADALDRVRQNAHVMPTKQVHAQLSSELGENWRDKFSEFDDTPIAAASIGQVHRATLVNGERVAIKIQYPGVADSIESDLLNLKRLVTYTNILPKGLYIDEIIRVGQEELTLECDYSQEADNQDRFRALIHDNGMDDRFIVPRVYRELSTARILTTELISGVPIDKAVNLSQDVRDSIGRRILELTVRELFEWRFMQTDPNWSNFMYNSATDKIGLVDFGAARSFPDTFVNPYFRIVWAAANEDEDTLLDYSVQLKFLTGDESPAMIRAHVAAGMVVGEPFRSHVPFDFFESELTKRLGKHTETFMHSRLTAPPQEVYSLHRKLAGAFLMCIKLHANVQCRDVLEDVHAAYVRDGRYVQNDA